MIWFGKKLHEAQDLTDCGLWNLESLKQEFQSIEIDKIIDVLSAFGDFLVKNDLFKKEIVFQIQAESNFSENEIIDTLKILGALLNKNNLNKRLNAEFYNKDILDKFIKVPHQRTLTHAAPHGTLLHVTAGNVFLSSIDSLIMGLITKNLSIIKTSKSNKFFPIWFAEKLMIFDSEKVIANKLAIVYWPSTDKVVESHFKQNVNAIIAWGGEEMVSSYKEGLPLHVKLIDFGPKISIQVITKEGFKNKDFKIVAQKICEDIIPWNQSACSSPQNLFLDEKIDIARFLKVLNETMKEMMPKRNMGQDEATEIQRERYRGLYSELMENGLLYEEENHLLHLETSSVLRPSPRFYSLIVKRFSSIEHLITSLSPFSYYLQSCSYLIGDSEKLNYLKKLSCAGIKRFSPLGTITWGQDGAPHDGRFVLRELIQFIGDEFRVVDYGESELELTDAKDLKFAFEKTPHPPGYIFSSGGTTGEPKFTHYSYQEFDFMTDMLSHNLSLHGITPNMITANLFVAGNLWSSFMAVEKALEKLNVIQLPIGAQVSFDNILMYLDKFKPQIVLGIPSFLVELAEYAQSQKMSITIDKVFYAGEALSSARMEYLTRMFKVKSFYSAGYASVDAGVIGYQCEHCRPGEHHVFSDLINLKIVDGEGIVSSISRETMPVKNYRTGDAMTWVDDTCACGDKNRKFKLLGRVDNTIHIWGCRLLLSDLEQSLQNKVLNYQVHLYEEKKDQGVDEILELCYEEMSEFNESGFVKNLYECSRDVRDTISFELFKDRIKFKKVDSHGLKRNARTGKISLILDQRH